MQDSARAESGARANWQACTTHAFLLDQHTSCTVFRVIVVFAITTMARSFTTHLTSFVVHWVRFGPNSLESGPNPSPGHLTSLLSSFYSYHRPTAGGGEQTSPRQSTPVDRRAVGMTTAQPGRPTKVPMSKKSAVDNGTARSGRPTTVPTPDKSAVDNRTAQASCVDVSGSSSNTGASIAIGLAVGVLCTLGIEVLVYFILKRRAAKKLDKPGEKA